jgi:hypothetical protein
MNTLTRVAVGIVTAGLLGMYITFLYVFLPNDSGLVLAIHAAALFILSVLYLVGLGIYKVWKAVKR